MLFLLSEKFNNLVSMYFQSLPPDGEMLNELLEQEAENELEKIQPQSATSRKIEPVSDIDKTNHTYSIAL